MDIGGKSPFALAFGDTVRSARLNLCWTQEELAYEVGVDRKTINRIERGLHSTSLDSARGIASALGLNLSTLVVRAERDVPR